MDIFIFTYVFQKRRISLFTTLLLCVLTLPAQPTEIKGQSAVWISAGPGASLAEPGPATSLGVGMMGRVGMTIQQNRWMGTLRLSMNSGGASPHDAFLYGKLRDIFLEAAVMPGYVLLKNEFSQTKIAAGVGVVFAEIVTNSSTFFGSGSVDRKAPTLGIPFELGTMFGKKDWYKAGLYVQGNINPIANFFGLSLCWHFGKLPI